MPDMETFAWRDTAATLAELDGGSGGPLRFDADRKLFVGRGLEVVPPLVQPVDGKVETAADWLEVLPEAPPLQVVVLLQAGAMSLGVFEGGEVVATKSEKKYVVRGSGRAQPTHLKTRGKSRYGSRLRLQNAKNLLVEVHERLVGWEEEHGRPEHVFYNAPVRLWADLRGVRVAERFGLERAIRIPMDVPVPTTEVLLQTWRRMCRGRVVWGGEIGGRI